MKLQLDGPVKAPKGTMIQVRAGRLDSGPRAVLRSETGRPNMKHATISSGGRRRRVSADTLGHIRAQASHHTDARNSDQIETGKVTIEIEGEETSELVLPTSMIEMLLEGIGASSAPAAPAAEPEPMDEPQVESMDADDEKLDAKIRQVATRIASDMLDKRERKIAADSARRSSVNADAATILPPGYDYSVGWTAVALDAIAKVDPDATARAKELAAKALRGDAVAEGMLRQMLAERRVARAPGVKLGAVKDDASEPPWQSPTMPASEVKQ